MHQQQMGFITGRQSLFKFENHQGNPPQQQDKEEKSYDHIN